jgi:hypothetical protein
VQLSSGIEVPPSSYALEGTKAHEIAAGLLVGDDPPKDCSQEMLEACIFYRDTIEGDEDGISSGYKYHVEESFDLSVLYPGLYGTADYIFYNPKTKLLRVYDFKYGSGILVEVVRNLQLMYYGLGALYATKYPCEMVDLIVVQPRCQHKDGPVRRWQIDPLELMDFSASLVEYAAATARPNAPLFPGDHCRFCPASGICPELREKAQALAKLDFSPVQNNNTTGEAITDNKKLGEVLSWLPILETWIKQVRQHAYGEALHGRTPPGWKLVQKRATRKWVDPQDAAEQLVKRTELQNSELFNTAFKSPAQVEKMLNKDGKIIIAELCEKISSGTTLAPEDDKRPGIVMDAQSQFSKVTNGKR